MSGIFSSFKYFPPSLNHNVHPFFHGENFILMSFHDADDERKEKSSYFFFLARNPHNDDKICFACFLSCAHFSSSFFASLIALYIMHVTLYVFNTFRSVHISGYIAHNLMCVGRGENYLFFTQQKKSCFIYFLLVYIEWQKDSLFPPNASPNIYLFISSVFCKLSVFLSMIFLKTMLRERKKFG